MAEQDITSGDLRMLASQISKELVTHSGKGYSRVIRYTVGGDLFEVADHGKTIYAGSNSESAAKAYNGILPS